jgi:hypothetical protein
MDAFSNGRSLLHAVLGLLSVGFAQRLYFLGFMSKIKHAFFCVNPDRTASLIAITTIRRTSAE